MQTFSFDIKLQFYQLFYFLNEYTSFDVCYV